MKLKYLASFLIAAIFTAPARADNPLLAESLPDTNVTIVGDTAYLFAGTDLYPKDFERKTFDMAYWRAFTSKDLVNWKLESTLYPEDTYMGKSTDCWAGHGIARNGKWFWYFSDKQRSVGVAVAEGIKGPWKDALGKPLLNADLTPTQEYDPSVLLDDDGRVYIVFGVYSLADKGYYIAELNDDMISLKGEPKRLVMEGLPDKGVQQPTDAPFFHKRGGLYYLSGRMPYAVSKNPFGPYKYLGSQPYGGHNGFFSFRGQDFVNYTSFLSGVRPRYRSASIAYLHYRADGSMSPTVEPLINKWGVGQYHASWDKIEAEWFMAIERAQKREKSDGGFEVRGLAQGSSLFFPKIHEMPANAKLRLTYAATASGTVEVREGASADSPLRGKAKIKPTGGGDKYTTLDVPLKIAAGERSLIFTFRGAGGELMRLDSFRVLPRK